MILKFFIMGLWNILKFICKMIKVLFDNCLYLMYVAMMFKGFYLLYTEQPITNTYLFFLVIIGIAMLEAKKEKEESKLP